jgi:DNA mismatch repair protein MutL
MANVMVLPENVVNKIAAGEVVERPASVVKELVENAIDAGATDISVELLKGGKSVIRVRDNGCGMGSEDARRALQRHSTSKIAEASDLFCISTMGFRGEALPSIAAISHLEITTKEKGATAGTRIVATGGRIEEVRECGAPDGTEVVVHDLFFNTPVRRKFLLTKRAELSRIASVITWHALARPAIGFSLISDGQEVLKVPPVKTLLDRLSSLFGTETTRRLVPLEMEKDGVSLAGFISKPELTRGNRTGQYFFINARPVRDKILSFAVFDAYVGVLPSKRHPVVFLFLQIEPHEVDVNVHPTKREVRFRNAYMVQDFLRGALRDTLATVDLSTEMELASRESVMREPRTTYTTRKRGGVTERVPGKEVSQEPLPWETEGVPVEERPVERELHALGQMRNLYILCEGPEGLAIIDQHAAHERILFEKLMRLYKEESSEVQGLLAPVVVNLTASEFVLASDYLKMFRALGIMVEKFGKNALKIDGLPSCLGGIDAEALVRDMIGELAGEAKGNALDEEVAELVAGKACHSAVKKRDVLKNAELQGLVDDLFRCANPYACPHGRPTIVKITAEELDKKFKRG